MNILRKILSLFPGRRRQKKISSYIDPDWENWKLRSYYYGMDKSKAPVPVHFDASISTNSTIMVRGGESAEKKRWGLHVFEAYANDDSSRITMILNKHVEEGRPVAELYYYAAVYGEGFDAYNWFRVGSDVPYHSCLFGRDRAVMYANVEFRNILSLDNIGRDDLLDEKPEENIENYPLPRENFKSDMDCKHARMGLYYTEEAKFQRKQNIKNARNGSMFYDKDNDIFAVKIGGKWRKVVTEELPEGVLYD